MSYYARRRPAIVLAVLLAGAQAGCAIHYYDAATGTEHVWGAGHLKMKVVSAQEGLEAVVRGIDTVGLSVGITDGHSHLTLGWHRLQYLDVLKESTAVRLGWPDGNFVNVRVGSDFPLTNGSPNPGDTGGGPQ